MERPDGREIAKPVELRVMVGDANDNRPTFPQMQYHTVVKELATKGYTHTHTHMHNRNTKSYVNTKKKLI